MIIIVVLGVLYKRMIGRDVPDPITKKQALIPVGLGVISLAVSFPITLASAALIVKLGYVRDAHPLWLQSMISAFIGAGFTEALSKFLMILIGITIFRSKIKNVYEYVLIMII